MRSNHLLYIGISLLLLVPADISAQTNQHPGIHAEEEVIVTSVPLATGEHDTSLPVSVLSGQALRENASATLGDTLSQQMGVTSASFGTGVGKPVIRGQSSNRVRILQDGTGAMDASAVSPDHANSVEPLIATRVEVIRGPATLLYGNGAIGGVVNVIDNRIPETLPEQISAGMELRHNTVNHGDTAVAVIDGTSGAFAWHLDGSYRDTSDVSIPGFTRLEIDEDEEHEEEEHEEEPNTYGFIGNSDQQTSSFTAGGSWIGNKAFLGFSVNQLKNDYGLPPGLHAHHNEAEGEEEEHLAAENIRLEMDQTRYDLKGGFQFDGFWENLDLRLSYTDYQHKEIENLIHEDGEVENEVGTVFSNEGLEGRITLKHIPINNWRGVVGAQLIDRTFGARGEEAFIPEADIRSTAIFAIESLSLGDWVHEFGLRAETQTTEPATCETSADTWSASASTLWNFRDDANILIALNRSERAPTVEELFSNVNPGNCLPTIAPEAWVPHFATGLYEIGNPALDNEQSTNMEIGFRKYAGDIRLEVNVYYNQIDSYIYLTHTGEEFEETEIATYSQNDANFRGVEAEITQPLLVVGPSHLDLTLFADFVRAEFDSGVNTDSGGNTNVPRIPPMRAGLELAWLSDNWALKLRATNVAEQDNNAEHETITDGYTLLNFYADYSLPAPGFSNSELSVFLKGNNLLDEEIRNHTSFIKNHAPEPGRGVEVGLRFRI